MCHAADLFNRLPLQRIAGQLETRAADATQVLRPALVTPDTIRSVLEPLAPRLVRRDASIDVYFPGAKFALPRSHLDVVRRELLFFHQSLHDELLQALENGDRLEKDALLCHLRRQLLCNQINIDVVRLTEVLALHEREREREPLYVERTLMAALKDSVQHELSLSSSSGGHGARQDDYGLVVTLEHSRSAGATLAAWVCGDCWVLLRVTSPLSACDLASSKRVSLYRFSDASFDRRCASFSS